jgi:hypothetical protein
MGAVGIVGGVVLTWVNPDDPALAGVEVWESMTNDRATATLITVVPVLFSTPSDPGITRSWTHSGLGSLEEHFYWIRPRSHAGIVGAFQPLSPTAGLSATTLEAVEIGSAPTFARLNLTDAVNQLTLDSDAVNTGTLSMAGLSAPRTWTLPNVSGTLISTGNLSDITNVGTLTTLTISGLTANSFLYAGVDGLLSSAGAPTNGQLLIGSTGAAPVRASLTGTANQITVTPGAGSLTLATPQNLHTGASPQFAGLALGTSSTTSGDVAAQVLLLQPSTFPWLGLVRVPAAGDLATNDEIGRLTFGAKDPRGASDITRRLAEIRGVYIGDASTTLDTALVFLTATGASGALERARLNGVGTLFINDTDNAQMTLGLTLNQGAHDNEILALKSSDVAHGVTDVSETDTYGLLKKFSATAGGLDGRGLSESTTGLALTGLHTTDNTTKTTAGAGAVHVIAQLKSGTTVADCGADANLLVIRNNATTRFIMDAEGSAHADIEWIAFDAYDDVALLNHLQLVLTADPVRVEFGHFVMAHAQDLEALGLIHDYRPEERRAMVNTTRLLMLLTGAVRQLSARLHTLERGCSPPPT